MKLSLFSIWFFIVLIGGNCAEIYDGKEKQGKYIKWEDLRLNNGKFDKGKVIVVDRNGGGDSLSVQGAVDMVPHNNHQRVKIHIRPGIYREKVHVPSSKPYISFIGDPNQASKTVITWHNKASDNGGNLGTWASASVTVESDYFCASEITFQNTVVSKGGNGYQAVALRIAGDKCMFYKARILGSQDTLLDDTGTHYFLQCYIQGSTDFIFGDARSLYQECTISVVGRAYAIAAQSRESGGEETGFSFVRCTVQGNGGVLLGRAYGDYSRVVYSFCELDVNVDPRGWDDWRTPSRQKTAVFGEYENKGKGSSRSGRVGWSKELSYSEAKLYLDKSFIKGETWLNL